MSVAVHLKADESSSSAVALAHVLTHGREEVDLGSGLSPRWHRELLLAHDLGEALPEGCRASSEPRVGLFQQARFSGIAAQQVPGHTHRNHQVPP